MTQYRKKVNGVHILVMSQTNTVRSKVLPSYMIYKSFRTATRSPKDNFDLLFL